VLVNFLLIPLYLSNHGQSTLGLMLLLVSMIAIAAVFDFGISSKATLSAAELKLNSNSETSKQFLMTGELFYWCVGAFIALLFIIYLAIVPSTWIWTVVEERSSAGWQWSVVFMLLLYIFFGWLQGFYNATLTGLEVNRTYCLSTITVSLCRLLLVYLALHLSTNLFFVFLAHVTCSAGQVIFCKSVFDQYVNNRNFCISPKEFLFTLKKEVNSDLLVIGVAATYLTQIDKLVLSMILPPDQFASYSVAAALAASLYLVINPLFVSLVPYFVRIIASKDEEKLRIKYGYASELASILFIPSAMILIFFSNDLLHIWLGNSETAKQADQVVAWLVAGTLANGFICIAYALQLAANWTSLAKKVNVISALLIVPFLWLSVSILGVQGSASTWAVLNITLLLIWPTIMHRKLIRSFAFLWLLKHFVMPCLWVGLAAYCCAQITEYLQTTGITLVIAIAASFIIASCIAFLSTKQVKSTALKYLNSYLKKNS
jgi:O-antigen/teichoic acid export membrane protein